MKDIIEALDRLKENVKEQGFKIISLCSDSVTAGIKATTPIKACLFLKLITGWQVGECHSVVKLVQEGKELIEAIEEVGIKL